MPLASEASFCGFGLRSPRPRLPLVILEQLASLHVRRASLVRSTRGGWAAKWAKPRPHACVPKKEGAGGLSSGPSFLAACGLGGRGIGRHQLLMSAGIAACRAERKRGGTPRSALTISNKQFTINLARRVQLG